MTRVVHYCRVSTVHQHPETPDGATAARKIANTLCEPMKQAMNEAWDRVLRIGIEYGYRAAERAEPLQEAIERALRATDGLKKQLGVFRIKHLLSGRT